MCVTDLDPDLELDQQFAEDDQTPEPNPLPASGQAPGVAWGRAEQHPAAK